MSEMIREQQVNSILLVKREILFLHADFLYGIFTLVFCLLSPNFLVPPSPIAENISLFVDDSFGLVIHFLICSLTFFFRLDSIESLRLHVNSKV